MFNPSPVPPSKEARAWAVEQFGKGARVRAVRRLTGGITSAMHLLSIESANGERHDVVLRGWIDDDHIEGADRVMRESHILEQLADFDIPSPNVLAIDPTGSRCGNPSLLMSRLSGRIELTPRNPDLWLEELVAMLVRIHAADVAAPVAESWLNREKLIIPEWSERPHLWRDAIALMDEGPPVSEQTFIHHDFQQFNVLWKRGRISGVVDWIFGSTGSPSMDVGHCRLNLAVLYSSEQASRFLELYESASGRKVSPWWDVHELLVYLPGWGEFLQVQAGRLLRVDFAGMHDRVERTLADALRRV
jgi:aminoglycoside phosphotransferase (APT) family kinase protein